MHALSLSRRDACASRSRYSSHEDPLISRLDENISLIGRLIVLYVSFARTHVKSRPGRKDTVSVTICYVAVNRGTNNNPFMRLLPRPSKQPRPGKKMYTCAKSIYNTARPYLRLAVDTTIAVNKFTSRGPCRCYRCRTARYADGARGTAVAELISRILRVPPVPVLGPARDNLRYRPDLFPN